LLGGWAEIPATELVPSKRKIKKKPKGRVSIDPTHPRGWVENATASSAGGSAGGREGVREGERKTWKRRRREGPEGEVCLGIVVIAATALVRSKRYIYKISPKGRDQGLDPTHPHGRSKTPPRPLRPLRETLQIRMGKVYGEAKSGSESGSVSMAQAIRRGVFAPKTSTSPSTDLRPLPPGADALGEVSSGPVTPLPVE